MLAVSLSLLGALGAAGCDGGPSLPRVNGLDGAVRFTYSGARNGTYAASGAADGVSASYAYAQPTADGWMLVYTSWAGQDGSSISLTFGFRAPAGPQTVDFDWRECMQDLACPGGVLFFVPPQTPVAGNVARDVAHQVFTYARGTIRITSTDGGRIRGTFSGAGSGESNAAGTLTLSDGAFDVPILQNP